MASGTLLFISTLYTSVHSILGILFMHSFIIVKSKTIRQLFLLTLHLIRLANSFFQHDFYVS